MGKLVIGVWARYNALTAAYSLIALGIIGCFYPFAGLGIYSIASGVFVLLFEWPVPGVAKLGTFTDNLWVRGVLYIFVAAPSFGQAATLTAACFLTITAVMYLCAAYQGEVWTDPKAGSGGEEGGKAKRGKGGMVSTDRNSSRPPSRPAPRQRADSQMEWQNSALTSASQTDAQGYAIGAPGPRTGGASSAQLLSPPS